MSHYLDWIIKIGGAITAIIGIWRIIVFFVHLSDDMKEIKQYVLQNIENVKDIPAIKDHCYENYLTSLRLTVMNKEMPLGERIIAGQKYLDLGGNGETKKYLTEELHINDIQN